MFAHMTEFRITKDFKRLEVKMWRAKQKELKKWAGRSDYDGVILLKSDRRPECWNVAEDPEAKVAEGNALSS